MEETYTCPRHGEKPMGVACPECLTLWPNLPHPLSMTGEERRAEMEILYRTGGVPFDMIHQRIEALVGRPVWTHEMGIAWASLCDEAAGERAPATMDEIIDLVPESKRVVVEVSK